MFRRIAMAVGLLLPLLAPGAASAAPISAVGSIAELQAGPSGGVVQVLSYYAGLNRGGGLFSWDAASTAPANGCTIFAAQGAAKSAAKGRWLRADDGPLGAAMCGAYWDHVHDDAAVLTRAFQVAASLHKTLVLPGGTGKVCSSVTAAAAVIIRGQGMGTTGAIEDSPTLVDGACMKSGWVFDIVTPQGAVQLEAPKYYDMSIKSPAGGADGGCIRWNSVAGGFTDDAKSQYYMVHPHAERINCEMQGSAQIGLECSKCFDGDFSQNNVAFGKTSIALHGSDVMCLGCAGPNRVAYASDRLILLAAHGTFGNMDRVVGNEILYPNNTGKPYDAMIYDASRSSTIEANHIEGVAAGIQSAIHLGAGFSHAIVNNDIDVLAAPNRAIPHWLVADGPFVNLQVFNNGCGGCILSPALFNGGKPVSPYYNDGGVPQVITHGGNAAHGDNGFPKAYVP